MKFAGIANKYRSMVEVAAIAAALLSLVLPGVARAGTTWEGGRPVDNEAAQLAKAFDAISEQDVAHLTGQEAKDVRKTFLDGANFILKVSRSAELENGEKAGLIVKVSEAAGRAFNRLTEPFVDPEPSPRAQRGNGFYHRSGAADAMDWVGERLRFALGSLARDLKTLPAAVGIGQDARRSRLAGKIAKDINKAFKDELKRAKTDGVSQLGIAGIEHLIESTSASEPMRFGAHHEFAKWTYRGLALFTFLMPPLELVITRSQFSPFVSGAIWGGAFLAVASARVSNSGLAFYSTMKKLRKSTRQALGGASCEALLGVAPKGR
jgi:hypothetical protein